MPKKDIKNFRQDMNKYFLRANEMLGMVLCQDLAQNKMRSSTS